MRLFEYTPREYVSTQVDLPLDLLQGQLETKQKEFDLQNAAIDKAAENFLKINPGMLTKDAYNRVMQQYMPQLEKIRDILTQTGNVSMAAPELSKFTTALAADPEVKNIMEDYTLTQNYNKALQEGRYTDKIFAGLYGPDGTPRPQLGPGQMTSSAYYAPMQFTDPVASILPEAEKFKATIIEDIVSNPNKYGMMQTDSETVEQIADAEVRKFVNDRYASWRQNPENQGYFWNATNYNPQEYKPEQWDVDVATPISNLLSYSKITRDRTLKDIPEQTIKPPSPLSPSPTSPAEERNKKTGAPVSRFIITGYEGGPASYQQGKYPGNVITNLYDFNSDLEFTGATMKNSYEKLVTLSNGVIPKGLDVITGKGGSRQVIRNWINDNYTKNQYGEWILKTKTDEEGNIIANDAPPVTPEVTAALNDFTEANYAYIAKLNLLSSLKEQTRVKDYDQTIIDKANAKAIRDNYVLDSALHHLIKGRMLGKLSFTDEEFNNIYTKSPQEVIDWINKIEKREIISKEDAPEIISSVRKEISKNLEGTNEGKIHKAFENFKNKLSEYQLSNLPGDGIFPEYERTIINMGIAGKLSGLTEIQTGVDASEGDGLTEFKEAVPYKDGDAAKGIDTDNISLSMGYSPKKGVVGVITMNGAFYEFDLDKANIDQQFTYEYPELAQELRIYRDISKSIRRSSNTEGKFNIGNISFEFDVKTKNIGTNKPEFYYEFSVDGINTYQYTNVGEIIARASDYASKKLDQKQALIDNYRSILLEEANDKLSRAESYEEREQIKKQYTLDYEQVPLKVEQVFNKNNKPIGKAEGKGKPQVKGPFNLGQ